MTEVMTVAVPDIGDFDAVEVIEVLVAVGDTVAQEDSLISLESDKATMEIPSPASGVVKEMKVVVGERVSEGSVILLLETQQRLAESGKSPAETPQEPAPALEIESSLQPSELEIRPASELVATPLGGKAHASPAIRRYARELGVELSHVSGSGPKGRVLKEDVKGFVKKALSSGAPAAAAAAGSGIPPIPKVDFSQFGDIDPQPLSRIQKISGKHLHACWLNVPHVTQFEEADITEMEAFRQSAKDDAAARGVRLTPLVFILKAVVAVLKEFPRFNASLDLEGEQLILKQYYNIGVAVDTPNGLMVPVIHHVDRKGVYELAEELMEISARAREGKLSAADLQGGTFSVSSLGGIGGTQFTPIVNAPEVAILGVARSQMKPLWNGAEFEPRLMLPLALSYDHRVIDGADGARFAARLGSLLSSFVKVLL
jgi:pyruvate dehydrogenase E2 component (dihydrolipoamide acetyltransferase)